MSNVILKQESDGTEEAGQSTATTTGEIIAFCPKCKTVETLWFVGDVLTQTRKFTQKDVRVYHDCGSNEPCRLLPCLLRKD